MPWMKNTYLARAAINGIKSNVERNSTWLYPNRADDCGGYYWRVGLYRDTSISELYGTRSGI